VGDGGASGRSFVVDMIEFYRIFCEKRGRHRTDLWSPIKILRCGPPMLPFAAFAKLIGG